MNIRQWRSHILERLRQQIALTADPALVSLLDEVQSYPMPEQASSASLQELPVESFFPADEATAKVLRQLAAA